jgi:peptidoglycan hydrolase-like protein with peptidoglycan-binding domain
MMANRDSLPTEVVRSIQNSLKEQGYLRGSSDGAYGPGTETALRKLESAILKKAGDYGDTCRYGGA